MPNLDVLENRLFLTTYPYSVPAGTTAVYLKADLDNPGAVEVHLNSPTSPEVTPPPFSNTRGMDVIDCGTLIDVLVVDQVPAAYKPKTDGTHSGIRVENGSGTRLRIEAGVNDTLMSIDSSSSSNTVVDVTGRDGQGSTTASTRFGDGVTHLELATYNGMLAATQFRTGTYASGEGTDVNIRSLVAGIHLSIATGNALYTKLTIGRNDTVVEDVYVTTGAGHNIVDLQESDGDDGANVFVDFGAGAAQSLGNQLIIHGAGSATLARAAGSHTIAVDYVEVHNSGSLTIADKSYIRHLDVLGGGDVTFSADGTQVDDFEVAWAGNASVQAATTIGTLALSGTVTFTGFSNPSTVASATISGTLRLLGSSKLTATAMTVNFGGSVIESSTATLIGTTVTLGGIISLGSSATASITTLNVPSSQTGDVHAGANSTLTVGSATIGGTLNLNPSDADISITTASGDGTINISGGGLVTVADFDFTGTVNVNMDAALTIEDSSDDGTDLNILNVYEGAIVTVENASDFNSINISVGSMLFKSTGSHVFSLNVTEAGTATLQERSRSPISEDARALVVTYMSLGNPDSPSGTLDLKDNVLIWDYPEGASKNDETRRLLKSGYNLNSNSGHWTGLGITSSEASEHWADAQRTSVGYNEAFRLFGLEDDDTTSYLGETVDASAIIVKYTWDGDASLDGQVDITDLAALATNWQTEGEWYQGDFDYSDFIDITDLAALATNWQQGVGAPLRPQGEAEGSQQEFLDGIDKLGLSEKEIEKLLGLLSA